MHGSKVILSHVLEHIAIEHQHPSQVVQDLTFSRRSPFRRIAVHEMGQHKRGRGRLVEIRPQLQARPVDETPEGVKDLLTDVDGYVGSADTEGGGQTG